MRKRAKGICDRGRGKALGSGDGDIQWKRELMAFQRCLRLEELK